jgi:hypothetical protein
MRVASIERLPTEILQPIFALSGYNLALIQASQILGTRLSSEYVYNGACDHFLTGACDDYIMRSTSQSSIFASKWMTWTFLKRWILKTFESSGCLCGRTPDEGCFDAQWPPNFENATSMVFSRSHLPRLAFIHCRLPKKLLAGPWTSDKVQFLRFLLWITSMTVDWRDPESHRLFRVDGKPSSKTISKQWSSSITIAGSEDLRHWKQYTLLLKRRAAAGPSYTTPYAVSMYGVREVTRGIMVHSFNGAMSVFGTMMLKGNG